MVIGAPPLDRAAHVEIEEAIVSEIYTFQKVIDPLEELYQAELSPVAHKGEPSGEDIHGLRDSLKEMRSEVLKRNAENRILLKSRMEIVGGEVLALRKPFAARPVYGNGEGGNLVDISG